MSSLGYLTSNIPPGGGKIKPLSIFILTSKSKLLYALPFIMPDFPTILNDKSETTPGMFNIRFSISPMIIGLLICECLILKNFLSFALIAEVGESLLKWLDRAEIG